MIQSNDIDKVFNLLKWISPRANQNIQIWDNKIPLMSNCVYKVQKFGQIKLLFFQVEDLSEANFRKIYKKRVDLIHLDFTLKSKENKWIFIWEPKNLK